MVVMPVHAAPGPTADSRHGEWNSAIASRVYVDVETNRCELRLDVSDRDAEVAVDAPEHHVHAVLDRYGTPCEDARAAAHRPAAQEEVVVVDSHDPKRRAARSAKPAYDPRQVPA